MTDNAYAIRSNYRERPFVYWLDLTDRERDDFGYLGTTEAQDNATFVRYLGRVYDLAEFGRSPCDLASL